MAKKKTEIESESKRVTKTEFLIKSAAPTYNIPANKQTKKKYLALPVF